MVKSSHKVGDLVYQFSGKTIGIITKIGDEDKEAMIPQYRMNIHIEYANGKTGRHSAAVVDGLKDDLKNYLRYCR